MSSEASPRTLALVVDDPATRSVLRGWLEGEAWEVVEPGEATEALGSPHVVCVDLDPGAGPHGVERLRVLGTVHTVVALVPAGWDEAGLITIHAGAYDFLTKPLDRVKLLVALSRAHERVTLLARLHRAEAALREGAASPAVTEAAVRPLRELEREAIAHALAACGGNVAHAARLLGLGRATLYRRLAELQIP